MRHESTTPCLSDECNQFGSYESGRASCAVACGGRGGRAPRPATSRRRGGRSAGSCWTALASISRPGRRWLTSSPPTASSTLSRAGSSRTCSTSSGRRCWRSVTLIPCDHSGRHRPIRARAAGREHTPTYRPSATRRPRKVQPAVGRPRGLGHAERTELGSRRLMVFGKPTFRFERPIDQTTRVVWLNEEQKAGVAFEALPRQPERAALHADGLDLRRSSRRDDGDPRFVPEQVSFISASVEFNVPGARRTRKRRPRCR